MTLEEVKAIRDKYYNALMDMDVTQMNHSIGDASYQPDGHRESLEKQLEYWDTMYNRKLSGGRTRRLCRKAV